MTVNTISQVLFPCIQESTDSKSINPARLHFFLYCHVRCGPQKIRNIDLEGKGEGRGEIINPATKPIQQPRPRSKLCQNDFLFHFTEAVPCFITSEFLPYSWGSPLELVSCLVKVYTCYSHCQYDLKGKNILQVKYSQQVEIQSTTAHVINSCMSHYVLSPSHLQQYYSRIHGSSDSGRGGTIRSSRSFW